MKGLFTLTPAAERLLDRIARWWILASVGGLGVLTVTLGLPTDPDGQFADIEAPAQLALLGLALLGALITFRMEAAAAVVEAFTALALGMFAAVQYRPEVAVLITLVFTVPAVLLWIVWQHEETVGRIAGLAVGTFMLVGGGYVGATAVYNHFFGPAHPGSELEALDVDLVEWAWTGGVIDSEATVVARVDPDASTVQLRVTDAAGKSVWSEAAAPAESGVVKLAVAGLAPGDHHDYTVVVDGVADASRGVGSFRTPAVGPMSFKVAVGSCARTGSNGAVFEAIAAEDPLLYLAVGDVHYGNIAAADAAPHLAAFDHMLTRPAQAALYRQTPVAYVWDDHDYGPNDADGSSPSRDAVREVYRDVVPHHPLPSDGPIHQAFTIGRVRFVLTDPRSERSGESMLGAEQRAWLVEELTRSSRTHALVVWANGAPWIGAEDPMSDGWAGFAAERTTVADAIAAAGIDNLVMVSGDAHMVAIDDGTNSAYASDGTGGFPVLHAAALDRRGSVKGGPYSEGAFPGGGQFGLLDITDDGSRVRVEMSGRDWTGATLVSYVFETTG